MHRLTCSAVKVILLNVEDCDEELSQTALNKMARALVTLATVDSAELRYVALRNLRLIIQKVPNLLSKNIQVFFCKYNDPFYVKMEKLELLISLATPKYVEKILGELKECVCGVWVMTSYATEADIDFVRAAVRAIGRCALKVEATVDKCVTVLLALLQSKINYVVQETVVVIRDIFRRYPNKYTSVIVPMCAVLELLDEPEAKASMIWVVGEYCDVIDNAGELLDVFLDSFHDETPLVQLEMLTAVVKLFLKHPAEGQQLVTAVLTMSTEECTNADVRDRGYMYWRLLSADAKLAKRVVLQEKKTIEPQLEEVRQRGRCEV